MYTEKARLFLSSVLMCIWILCFNDQQEDRTYSASSGTWSENFTNYKHASEWPIHTNSRRIVMLMDYRNMANRQLEYWKVWAYHRHYS